MYHNPAYQATPAGPAMTDPRQLQEHFEDFYEDIFEELDKYGEVENLNVCDNQADHLVGNVYVKFREEESAAKALAALAGRFYNGRTIIVEFSPVTDFREATCRQYEERSCNRGGFCNFMHLKPISRDLRRRLFGRYKSRSRSPPRRRRESRSRSRDRDRDRRRDDRDRRRSRSRSRERRRSRSRERGGGGGAREPVTAKGMTDEERRAMFAQWNAKAKDGDDNGDAHHEGQQAAAEEGQAGHDAAQEAAAPAKEADDQAYDPLADAP